MVLMTVGIIALLGISALAVDLGTIWTQRREMQTAADAAALAGDHEIYSGNGSASNLTPISNAAQTDSAKNGCTNGSNGVTVAVYAPPIDGLYTGDDYAVEVIDSKAEPTFFLRVLGISSLPVSTRAVARYSASTGCVYALDPSANNALNVSGSGRLNAACNIYVNSTSTSGLVCSGGATITATDPTTGDPLAINDVATAYSGSCYTPPPTTGTQPAANPFASLAFPPAPTPVFPAAVINAAGHAPLNPGTYTGGITVSGGNSVSLNPGNYYLNGGGLNVSGGSSITGTGGVTFFNTGTASGATKYGPIVISGTSATDLVAPSSGTYAGILFFQDPSIGSSNKQNTVSGGSTSVFTGALYFPTSPLVYSGGSVGADCTEIVADTITISGASAVSNNCTLFGSNGPAVKFPTLAE